MKKLTGALVAITFLIGLLTAGCYPWSITAGTGPVKEQTYGFRDFTNIEISSNIKFEINQSAAFSVKVTTHVNILDLLDIHQSGKTLIIKLKPGAYANSDVQLSVTLPAINKLKVSGATRGSIEGFRSNQDFEMLVSGASQADIDIESGDSYIEISGASKVRGKLKAGDLRLTVSGASRCEIEGSAENADIIASGASYIECVDFRLKNVNITASGASRADIYADGELSLDISGASTLSYGGKPTINKINVSGVSKIIAN